MDAAFFAYTSHFLHRIKGIMPKDTASLERSKKNPDTKKGSSVRQLKVNAVYGEMSLVECMKNVMKEKTRLK